MRLSLVASAFFALASAQNFQSLESLALSLASALEANTGNPAAEKSLEAEVSSIVGSLGGELSSLGINYSSYLSDIPGFATATAADSQTSATSTTPQETGSGSSSSSRNHAPAPTAMGLTAAAAAGLVGVAALL